jgi:hypothetical protein
VGAATSYLRSLDIVTQLLYVYVCELPLDAKALMEVEALRARVLVARERVGAIRERVCRLD